VAEPLPTPCLDLDADEIVPDSELEFEDLKNAVQDEHSGDSSDDFVPDESSQSDVPQGDDSAVPLRISKATASTSARPFSSKGAPSSKSLTGRRLFANAHSEVDSSEPSDTDDSFVDTKKASRRKKAAPTRGKGRRGPQPQRRRRREAESAESSNSSDGLPEPSDDDARPPPRSLQPNETLALIKAAHRKMRKKLRRKLTPVRFSIPHPS
jgi:hypothetical protein